MSDRILMIGASGSGTTTLGKLVAQELSISHIDLDDLFWLKTDVPFTKFRNKNELKEVANEKIYSLNNWVISGDPSSWEIGIELFLTTVFFLKCSTTERVNRLQQREFKRFGAEILEGGKFYENHQNFIDWTQKYDVGGVIGRTLKSQITWLNTLTCPIYNIQTDLPLVEVFDFIKNRYLK